jgi:hypothetical protein
MIDALINDNILMHCVLLFGGGNRNCIQNIRKDNARVKNSFDYESSNLGLIYSVMIIFFLQRRESVK